MPKYGKPATDPRIVKILKIFTVVRSILPICFQQALKHCLHIILSHDMSKNVFWAQNTQIW